MVVICVPTTLEFVLDLARDVLDQQPQTATSVTSMPTGAEQTVFAMLTGLVMTVPYMMRLVIIVVTDVVDQATSTVLNVLETPSELTPDTVNATLNGVDQDVPTGLVCVIHVAQPVTDHSLLTVRTVKV